MTEKTAIVIAAFFVGYFIHDFVSVARAVPEYGNNFDRLIRVMEQQNQILERCQK